MIAFLLMRTPLKKRFLQGRHVSMKPLSIGTTGRASGNTPCATGEHSEA